MPETSTAMIARDQQTQQEFDASAARMEGVGWGITGIIILMVAVKAIRKGRSQ